MSDLTRLKDAAREALETRNYRRAGELFTLLAHAESANPDWRRRAAEAYRCAGDPWRAVDQFRKAASSYAVQGFLAKAIEVCKAGLRLDPAHEGLLAQLARLSSRREEGLSVPQQAATH